jgi:hypothetical protein
MMAWTRVEIDGVRVKGSQYEAIPNPKRTQSEPNPNPTEAKANPIFSGYFSLFSLF